MKIRTALALATALVVPVLFGATDAGAKGSARGRTQVTGQVNLNTATVEQIKLLPRMRLQTAQAIVTHRATQRFVTIRDVMKVKGVGQKSFLRLKDHLAVDGPNTLKRVQAAKPPRAPKASKASRTRRTPPRS